MPVPVCSLQLAQDRSRAEEYVQQSLPYLRDAQAPVREAAIRFIGEPQPLVPLWAAWPQPAPLCWQQGAALGLPECRLPRARRGPPSAPLPPPVGLVAPCSAPPQLLLFSGVTLLRGGGGAAQPAGPGAALLGACWGAGGLTELCA